MLTVVSAIAPMHATPDERSERVSECLLGEPLAKLSDRGKFTEVRAEIDGYIGYVEQKHLQVVSPEKLQGLNWIGVTITRKVNRNLPGRFVVAL